MKSPFVWQLSQATSRCLPSRGYFVFEWSKVVVNVDFFHVAVEWQLPQSCLNSPLCGSVWQAAHVSNAIPAYFGCPSCPAVWHFLHSTFRCAPVSLNLVFEWSKFRSSSFAPFQLEVVWHCVQLAPNRPWCLSS